MTNPSYPNPSYNLPGSAPVTPPGTVRGAFLIYIVSALISVIGIILALSSDVWDEAVVAAGAQNTDINVDTLVSTAKTLVVVVGAIFVALYLFFAFKMRAGRNWARIVLTVLSGLSIISAFTASASVTVGDRVYTDSFSQITGYLSGLLSIVAIVLMFMGASNQYFAAMKGRR